MPLLFGLSVCVCLCLHVTVLSLLLSLYVERGQISCKLHNIKYSQPICIFKLEKEDDWHSELPLKGMYSSFHLFVSSSWFEGGVYFFLGFDDLLHEHCEIFQLHLLFYFSSEVYSFTYITLFYIVPFSRSRVLLNYIFSAHLVLMSLLSSSLILEGLHLAFGLEGYFCWMHTQCSSGAFPSGLEIYPSLPFWPLRFLLRTSLLFWQLWLYRKLDASVFMLLLFFCCSVLRLTVITCYKKIPF